MSIFVNFNIFHLLQSNFIIFSVLHDDIIRSLVLFHSLSLQDYILTQILVYAYVDDVEIIFLYYNEKHKFSVFIVNCNDDCLIVKDYRILLCFVVDMIVG